MAKQTNPNSSYGESTSSLVQGIASDTQRLISQHFDLLKAEMKEELDKAKDAARSFGTGVGASALAGVLGSLMLVHLLQKMTGLPPWACYGLVGGAAGALGARCLSQGVRQASDVRLVPEQTVEVLQEEFGQGKPAPATAGA